MTLSPRLTGILFAVTTGVCWALLAITLKYALHFYSSGTIVWARMTVAATVMLIFYLVKNPRKTFGLASQESLGIVIAGLFLAANYFSYMRGLELTTASNAQIMIQLGPLALLLVGFFISRKACDFINGLVLVSLLSGF